MAHSQAQPSASCVVHFSRSLQFLFAVVLVNPSLHDLRRLSPKYLGCIPLSNSCRPQAKARKREERRQKALAAKKAAVERQLREQEEKRQALAVSCARPFFLQAF